MAEGGMLRSTFASRGRMASRRYGMSEPRSLAMVFINSLDQADEFNLAQVLHLVLNRMID
jgi:hypothetical protein